jgi:NADPH:quinone reductase-like Zn-dependent oxidoreductase
VISSIGILTLQHRSGELSFLEWPAAACNHLAKMFKNLVAVSAFGMFTLAHHSDAMREMVQELLLMVSREGIHPTMGQVYALRDSGQALTALESRSTYGKLLLKP